MSVYFQHLSGILWPLFDTSLFQRRAFWMARGRKTKQKKKNPTPDIHATNLQRQDKEIHHVKYEEI